jgi:hypothetical protein
VAPSKGRRVLKRKRAEHLRDDGKLYAIGGPHVQTSHAARATPYTRCPHAAAVAAAAAALSSSPKVSFRLVRCSCLESVLCSSFRKFSSLLTVKTQPFLRM